MGIKNNTYASCNDFTLLTHIKSAVFQRYTWRITPKLLDAGALGVKITVGMADV